MKAILAYTKSWKSVAKYRFVILFLFLANVIFTFIVTSPFTIYFRTKFQFTTALDSYSGYDVNAIFEFLNNYGQALEPLNTLIVLSVIAFFIFGIYANAAILYAVMSKNKIVALRPFWNGGLNFFWKILRVSVYYLFSIVLLLVIAWRILLAVGINILEVPDDIALIRRFRIAIIICIFFAAIFSTVKQYAKIFIAIDKKPLISASILKSGKFVLRFFLNTMLLYVCNIVVMIGVFLLYVVLRNAIDVNSWVILFLLGQLLLLYKITARVIHLDSSYKLYESIESVEV